MFFPNPCFASVVSRPGWCVLWTLLSPPETRALRWGLLFLRRTAPILTLINKIKIVSNIGWSPAISAWDCHLIHGNDIGLLSTAAMKCLHWTLFCQNILPVNFLYEFSKYVLQKDKFSKRVFQWGRIFFRTSFHSTMQNTRFFCP